MEKEGIASRAVRKGILCGLIAVPPHPDSGDRELATEIQNMTEDRIRTLFPGITNDEIKSRIEKGNKWALAVLNK